MKYVLLLMVPLSWASNASGQQDVGYVSNSNVSINGTLAADHGQTILGPSSALTTFQRPARVVLSRGGMLTVCQGSAVHLEAGHGGRSTLKPIHLSLDLGSMEILTLNTASDSITAASGVYVVPDVPDHEQTGVLHIAMRVGANGRTCVENRGNRTSLSVMDATGESAYLLKPGQRVVFASGSVKTASPSVTGSCGCPAVAADGTRTADNVSPLGRDKSGSSDRDGSPFPFPVGESKIVPEPEALDEPRIRTPNILDYSPTLVVEMDASLAGADRLSGVPADILALPAPTVIPRLDPNARPAKGTKDRDAGRGFFANISHFFSSLFS